MTARTPSSTNEAVLDEPSRGAWALFALLFALMAANFLDRQVVVSMFPHLEAEWGLSDRALGALASVVSGVVALATIPLSFLADRWHYLRAIVVMALVWSLATLACAFAANYWQLLALRSVVGLGEAAYATSAVALLAAVFPEARRSTVLAAFLTAAVLGSVVGVAIGGVVATRWDWRIAFIVAAVPGIALALVAGGAAAGARLAAIVPRRIPVRISLRHALATALATRTLLLVSLAQAAQLFVVSTVYAWMPSYLGRYHGMALDRAALAAAGLVALSGAGSIAIGSLVDRRAARNPAARLNLPALVVAAAMLCLAVGFGAGGPRGIGLAAICAGAFAMAGTIGPATAAVIDVAPRALRATFAALLTLVQTLLGLAGGPVLVGALSDRYGLDVALAGLPMLGMVALAGFMLAARHYAADVRRARALDLELDGEAA